MRWANVVQEFLRVSHPYLYVKHMKIDIYEMLIIIISGIAIKIDTSHFYSNDSYDSNSINKIFTNSLFDDIGIFSVLSCQSLILHISYVIFWNFSLAMTLQLNTTATVTGYANHISWENMKS